MPVIPTFLLSGVRESPVWGRGKCDTEGTFWSAWKFSVPALGKEPAGLGREESRTGLGKQWGGKGEGWLVCVDKAWIQTCHLGLGPEDVAK